jgi:hypothetical protein
MGSKFENIWRGRVQMYRNNNSYNRHSEGVYGVTVSIPYESLS